MLPGRRRQASDPGATAGELQGEPEQTNAAGDGMIHLFRHVRALRHRMGKELIVGEDGCGPDASRNQIFQPLGRGARSDDGLEDLRNPFPVPKILRLRGERPQFR